MCGLDFLGVVIDDQTVVALVRTVVEIGKFLGDQSFGVGSVDVGANVFNVGINHGRVDKRWSSTACRVRPETF